MFNADIEKSAANDEDVGFDISNYIELYFTDYRGVDGTTYVEECVNNYFLFLFFFYLSYML